MAPTHPEGRQSAGEKLAGTPEPMHVWEGTGGVRIAADSWGDAQGPVVILQHGGGQTRHAWKAAGERLGNEGYRAIALDARGHGDSDWSRDRRYGSDVMIADLEHVLQQLGVNTPVLVGASMGGITSLVAAGEGRIAARALVLVDIATEIDVDGVRRIGEFMSQKPEGFSSLQEVADAIASYQPHRERPRNLDGLAKNLRRDAAGRYRWHWDPAFRAAQVDVAQRRLRLEASARALSVPTLLVRGGLSDVLTEAGVQRFLQLCPQAEYVNVGNAGHMVAGDRNDVFADAVIAFLKRRLPARPVRV